MKISSNLTDINENTIVVGPMTLKDLVISACNRDWNTRKYIEESQQGETVTFYVPVYAATVPAELVKQIYNKYVK